MLARVHRCPSPLGRFLPPRTLPQKIASRVRSYQTRAPLRVSASLLSPGGCLQFSPPTCSNVFVTQVDYQPDQVSSDQPLPGEASFNEGMKLLTNYQIETSFLWFQKSAQEEYPPASLLLMVMLSQTNALLELGYIFSKEEMDLYQPSRDKVFEHRKFFELRMKANPTPQDYFHMACLVLEEVGVPCDTFVAQGYIRDAAEQGHPLACFQHAKMAFDIRPPEHRQYDLAEPYFQRAASHGYLPALVRMANIVAPQNPPLAVTHFITAANGGHVGAQDIIAKFYQKNGDMKLALKYWKMAAHQHHQDAQFNTALIYQTGYEGIPRDDDMAYFYLKQAADAGHIKSQLNLGVMFQQGTNSIEKDEKKGLEYLKMAADQYDARGQFNYAVSLPPSEEALAMDYMARAAAQGFVPAQYNLGLLFRNKKNKYYDEAKAFQYLKDAAEKNDANAQLLVGEYYEEGLQGVVEKDLKKAFENYEAAADQGNIKAQALTAICYQEGRGTEKDEKLSLFYWKYAADQGDPHAQLVVGSHYSMGVGVEPAEDEDQKNLETAFEYYKKSADQGFVDAQGYLGHAYLNGRGVPRNEKLGFQYFKLAADQGNSQACLQTSLCYGEGVGVDIDELMAFNYCKKAADQGLASAIYNLGCYYKVGTGVEPSDQKAIECFITASDLGDPSASVNAGVVFMNGIGVPEDPKQGFAYFQKASQQEDGTYPDAWFYSGVCHQDGVGVEPNLEMATNCFERAAQLGHPEAVALCEAVQKFRQQNQ